LVSDSGTGLALRWSRFGYRRITGRRLRVWRLRHRFGCPDTQAGPVQSGHLPKMARAQTMTSKGTRSHGASTARNFCKRSSR
jgi:hypothetical protein